MGRGWGLRTVRRKNFAVVSGTLIVDCTALPPRTSHTLVQVFPSWLHSRALVAGAPPPIPGKPPPPPTPTTVRERTVTAWGNSYWIHAKPSFPGGRIVPLVTSLSVSIERVKSPPLAVSLASWGEAVPSGSLTARTAISPPVSGALASKERPAGAPFWKAPTFLNEGGSWMSTAPPLTSAVLQTSFFMFSSGFTQGPAVALNPAQEGTPISRSSESARRAAKYRRSFHTSLM